MAQFVSHGALRSGGAPAMWLAQRVLGRCHCLRAAAVARRAPQLLTSTSTSGSASRAVRAVAASGGGVARRSVHTSPAAVAGMDGPDGLAPLSTRGTGAVGCGSNVVDMYYRVSAMPTGGGKGYFSDDRRLGYSSVGGVTLNHLAWARLLGVPAALLAVQGDDEHGRTIRRAMAQRQVSAEWVRVSAACHTSASFVFVDP